MTTHEAAALVQTYGGTFVPSVNRRTSLLVVGQEGWPLRKDGRLTQKLRKARLLQRQTPLVILTEEALLSRLGLASRSDGIRRLYTLAELTRILRVRRDCLRAWMQSGLIRPAQTEHGLCYFDYRQVSGAKTLSALAQAGVTKERLRRSLRQLQAWLPEVEEPLAQLALLESGGKVLVRLEGGRLAEPTGQLVFDFEEAEPPADGNVLSTQPAAAADWFVLAGQHEEAGRLREAVHAYRQALRISGPTAATCFNLGNTLLALGQTEAARQQLCQAVELQPDFVAAWNNLGTVLEELGRWEEARAAYVQALALDPGYADAHYNLADLLETMGRGDAAERHWRAYVQRDADSQWGRHARRRLSATEPD
jgi:tetratricopeptide (TPR) repeat protein